MPASAMHHVIARNGVRFSCGVLPPAGVTLAAFIFVALALEL
jgi:hypothetical protein